MVPFDRNLGFGVDAGERWGHAHRSTRSLPQRVERSGRVTRLHSDSGIDARLDSLGPRKVVDCAAVRVSAVVWLGDGRGAPVSSPRSHLHTLASIGRGNPPVCKISRVGDKIGCLDLCVSGLRDVVLISSMVGRNCTNLLGRAEIVLGAHLAVQRRSLLVWRPHLQLLLNLHSHHPLVGRLYRLTPLLGRVRSLSAD